MLSGKAIASEAQAKADIYGFLAKVFSAHPTGDTAGGVCRMAAEMGIACATDFCLMALDREYMDLFVVPGPRYVAPYESVFRDERPIPAVLPRRSSPGETGSTKIKGLLMGESTLQVRQAYLRAGVLPEEDLPDHIANELRFMAYTWSQQAESTTEEAAAWNELRKDFRREHVLKWIGELREKVAERERLGYYRVALHIAEVLLQDDAE